MNIKVKTNTSVGFLRKSKIQRELKTRNEHETMVVNYATIPDTNDRTTQVFLGGFHNSAAVGSIVTVPSLSMKHLTELRKFTNWSPSLAYFELF